jgi:hypothetical protein
MGEVAVELTANIPGRLPHLLVVQHCCPVCQVGPIGLTCTHALVGQNRFT